MVPTATRSLLARLATPFDPDAFLSVLHPLWGTKLRGVVESVTPVGRDAAALTIRPGAGWSGHVPGQHLTLGVRVDGVIHHRCYSITSPPGRRDHRGPLVELTVQAQPEGTVSAHLAHRTRPGDVVRLAPAAGELTPDFGAGPVLLVTAGSGLTPALGMLRALEVERPAGLDVVLLHHATDPDRCLHLDELERLDHAHDWLRVTTTFTRTAAGSRRRGVHLDRRRLDRLCGDWRTRAAYACGPEPMLEQLDALWQREDVVAPLRTERFTSPTTSTPPAGTAPRGGAVRFERSALQVDSDGTTSLLELAESAGLAPPSGCRMGICHTCSTRLEDGCAVDLRDGRTATAGQHVQLCVSAAASDLTLAL